WVAERKACPSRWASASLSWMRIIVVVVSGFRGWVLLILRDRTRLPGACMRAILDGLDYLDPTGEGLTVTQILRHADSFENREIQQVADLREALRSGCNHHEAGLPNTLAIDYLFRKLRKRVTGGRYLEKVVNDKASGKTTADGKKVRDSSTRRWRVGPPKERQRVGFGGRV